MTRRKRGTGTIVTMADGRFRVRFGVDGTKESFGIYPTYEEADTTLNAIVASARAGGAATNGGITLARWADIVLDRREQGGGRSVASERQRWSCYVVKAGWPCAGWPLREIARADVKRWLRGLKVGDQTKRNALNLMRAIFREAVEDELIETNPCGDMSVKSKGSSEETSTFLTLSELSALLWSTDEDERPIVAIAAGTGLRQGELRSLLLRDVILTNDEPHIIVRFGAPGKPTKNGRIRRVPLFGLALAAMRAWLATMRGPNPKGLAFPTVRGCVRPKGRIVMPKDWARWLRVAGIRRTVRWHDLRHTCATLLLQAAWARAWTLEEVKEMLGHSSVRVTERYAKATGSLAERAAKEMGPRIDPVLARNGMQRWEPSPENHSERRGSDSNRRMTVLQGVDKRRNNEHLAPLVVLAGSLQESAARYMSAMMSQSPSMHRIGSELAGAALDTAEAIRQVTAPPLKVVKA